MTSTCSQSAPRLIIRMDSSPSFAKSAERIEGAIKTGRSVEELMVRSCVRPTLDEVMIAHDTRHVFKFKAHIHEQWHPMPLLPSLHLHEVIISFSPPLLRATLPHDLPLSVASSFILAFSFSLFHHLILTCCVSTLLIDFYDVHTS